MRRRFVTAIAAVATAAVILFALPLGWVLAQSYRDKELLRLQRDTVSATRQIDVGSGTADPVELPVTRDALTVYDRSGRRVAGRGPVIADALARSALATGKPTDSSAGGRLVAVVPLIVKEQVVGAVRAVRDDGAVARELHNSWLALGGLAAGLVLSAALAAVLLGRRLLGPLERLAVAARRLGEGDFTSRAPPAGVPEVDAVGAALEATAERLNDLVSRERAFSADASHQLRTPLAALRIELEALQLRGEQLPELSAALAQIDRLQTTVDTLLAVARDAPRRPTETDVAALVSDAEARWRGPLAVKGRPLRTLVRAGDPRAFASPAVVGEILDVLLDNANRHGAGEVRITVRQLDGAIAVDIRDEGSGFRGEPDKTFVRRASGGKGRGIGLALARSLAEAEGGRLTIRRPGPEPIVTLLLRKGAAPGSR